MLRIWKTFHSMHDGRFTESGRSSSEACCRKVLVYNRMPWKAVLHIPQMSKIPVSLIQKALEDQGQPPPSFPLGDFRVVYNDPVVQIAIFRYRHSFGCRDTSSTEHDCLPFPEKTHKDPATFLQELNIRVGYHCAPRNIIIS